MRLIAVALFLIAASVASAAPPIDLDARRLYTANCASCHADDGRGGAAREAGYPVTMPDFTECRFATPEANTDWLATAHFGGNARGFDRKMPAFDQVLTDGELDKIINYLRHFCSDPRWPRGELNFPRSFLTEKAYPEDEATITVSASRLGATTQLQYERRFGARYQLEVVAPVVYAQQANGGWAGGVGDLAVAMKRVLAASLETGSILSGSVEVQAPTGRTDRGFGVGTTMFEGSLSFGQALPANGFLHAQVGLGIAYDRSHPDEAFVRGAVGDALTPVRWGRLIAPMLEVMVARDLDRGSPMDVDLVPQVQVTLSSRQHIRASVGIQVPITDRTDRATAVLGYLLWDWADGGLTEGW